MLLLDEEMCFLSFQRICSTCTGAEAAGEQEDYHRCCSKVTKWIFIR